MNYLEGLYHQIPNISDHEFYQIEPEFCRELYYHIPDEKKPICVIAFLTIVNWFAASQRSGVWTFYEAARPKDIETTLQFLEQTEDADLTSIFRYGIHEYQSLQYAENYDYPSEWIDEANEIDKWIEIHNDWLYAWERKLLTDNKNLICSLLL